MESNLFSIRSLKIDLVDVHSDHVRYLVFVGALVDIAEDLEIIVEAIVSCSELIMEHLDTRISERFFE